MRLHQSLETLLLGVLYRVDDNPLKVQTGYLGQHGFEVLYTWFAAIRPEWVTSQSPGAIS